MPSHVQAIPVLRLATDAPPATTRALPRRHRPAPATLPAPPENPHLSATDARWVLAVRAAGYLQGGRAALLIPEHRHALLALALRMGLRPFDANLVIAVVQDAARAGLEPLSADTESRLSLICPPASTAQDPILLLAASAALAAGLFIALLAWLGAV